MSGQTLLNSATLFGNLADPATGNNTSSVVSTGLTKTDLSISKSVNLTGAYSGQTVIYTLMYGNS